MLKKLWKKVKEVYSKMCQEPVERQMETIVNIPTDEMPYTVSGPAYWAERAEQIRIWCKYEEMRSAELKKQVDEWKRNNALVNDYFTKHCAS